MTSEGSPAARQRGTADARGLRVAVLVARYNADVTERLLDGARKALEEHGASASDVEIVHVPGAWELPQAAQRAVDAGRFDAVITLGCVIRGETPHFDFVCAHASLGLGEVARTARVPVVFGVLTTDDRAQALVRAGEGAANKGFEAAVAALEMVSALRRMEAG